MSKARYQKFADAVRERFLQARREVLAGTSEISEEEIAVLVETAVIESRHGHADKEEPPFSDSG